MQLVVDVLVSVVRITIATSVIATVLAWLRRCQLVLRVALLKLLMILLDATILLLLLIVVLITTKSNYWLLLMLVKALPKIIILL